MANAKIKYSKFSSFDKRHLNDVSGVSQAHRDHFSLQAKGEAQALMDKHRGAGVYAALLAEEFAALANAAAQQDLKLSKPNHSKEAVERAMRPMREDDINRPSEQTFFGDND